MVPSVQFPSINFFSNEKPRYDDITQSIEEKTQELEQGIGCSSLPLSARRKKNSELSLQKAVLLAALQNLRDGKISYHAFSLQCSKMMESWDQTLNQISQTSFVFSREQEQIAERLALSTFSLSKNQYPDFIPPSSSYFPFDSNKREGNLKAMIGRTAPLKTKESLQKDLLQAAMKTARFTTVSLEAAGIGFMGYAVLTGGALPLAIGVVGMGACFYAASSLIEASMPASWKEALKQAPEKLEEKYDISQEEVKQFMEDLSFLAFSAVAIPGVRAVSNRCRTFLDALARKIKESPKGGHPPLLDAPGSWKMHLPENMRHNPYVAFFREKDPTLYVCSLESTESALGIDAGIESTIRTLAQNLNKESVHLTFAYLERTAAERNAPSLPSLQRLLPLNSEPIEGAASLFLRQEGSVTGRSISKYFDDAMIFPSSLEKLSTVVFEVGKTFGKIHSFPIGTATIERVERNCLDLDYFYQESLRLFQECEIPLLHSKEEISMLTESLKKSRLPIYGFSHGELGLLQGSVLYDETSSKVSFIETGFNELGYENIPEQRCAFYECMLVEHMVGIGLDAKVRSQVLDAWKQGYQEAYTCSNSAEIEAFYQAYTFYEYIFLMVERLGPSSIFPFLKAHAPEIPFAFEKEAVFPFPPAYRRALKQEKEHLNAILALQGDREAILNLSAPENSLANYLSSHSVARTEFPETSYSVNLLEWESQKLIAKQAPLTEIQKEIRMNSLFQSLNLAHSSLPTCLAIEIDTASSRHSPMATLYMTHQPGKTLESILIDAFRSTPSSSFSVPQAEAALYHTAKGLAELHGKAIEPTIPQRQSLIKEVSKLKKSFLALSKDSDLEGIALPHTEDSIQRIADAFLLNPGHTGYIHGDLHLRNLLFDDKSQKLSFLDLGNSAFFLSTGMKPEGYPLNNLYDLFFIVESLAREEKASPSLCKRLSHSLYQGYSSEETPFLSKEACYFYHVKHYYQQAALLLSEKKVLPDQVFVYRMQKILDLLKYEAPEERFLPTFQTDVIEISSSETLWNLGGGEMGNFFNATLKGSYRIVQSELGERILFVTVDYIEGEQNTLSSFSKLLAQTALDFNVDRIQMTAEFENKKLKEILTRRYGLRATEAPWVYEQSIEELLNVGYRSLTH